MLKIPVVRLVPSLPSDGKMGHRPGDLPALVVAGVRVLGLKLLLNLALQLRFAEQLPLLADA